MKDYAKKFYSSSAWKKCRAAYAKSVGGLCEKCLAAGRIRAGVIVHHKIHITPELINRPDILTDPANLCLLCRDCHAREHAKQIRRYQVDELGRVIASE